MCKQEELIQITALRAEAIPPGLKTNYGHSWGYFLKEQI